MGRMRLTILLAALSLSLGLSAADEALSVFVARARQGNGGLSTFASLRGKLAHRRRGAPLKTMPIYFGVITGPKRSNAQLVLDNREYYNIGQSHERGISTVVPKSGTTELLDWVGVMATDLLLGFIYYPVKGERDSVLLSGIVRCRVVEFDAPDSDDIVLGYLAAEYAFPLKAEFYHRGEDKPYRTLEAGGFTRNNDLYYPKRITVEGPGWRTRIDFDQAELGYFNPSVASRVFLPTPKDGASSDKE